MGYEAYRERLERWNERSREEQRREAEASELDERAKVAQEARAEMLRQRAASAALEAKHEGTQAVASTSRDDEWRDAQADALALFGT